MGQRKGYLYKIVLNACMDHLRRQKHVDSYFSAQDLYGCIPDEDAAERSFNEAALWTAVDTLPVRCRQVLLMSKRDNMKYKEIAKELGISEKTVENQICKALKILRSKAQSILCVLFGIA